MQRSWVVVVPVKPLAVAKSRLGAALGAVRRELALAMALDTVTVAASCQRVRVLVVTDDDLVADAVRAATSRVAPVRVVPDEPRAGINAALVHGARVARPLDDEGVAALSADLPALQASELTSALQRAAAHPRAFVADANGTGTTLYAVTSSRLFDPRFGAASAAAHARTAVALDLDGILGLRRDVDTFDDLRAAIELGLAPRTALVISSRRPDLSGVINAARPAIRPAS